MACAVPYYKGPLKNPTMEFPVGFRWTNPKAAAVPHMFEALRSGLCNSFRTARGARP